MSNSLDAYLILSGILFAIGSFGFLARRNAISMLMSIELMLNAVNLAIVAFAAFSRLPDAQAQGSVIALMVMAVAAAEATVGPGHRHRDLSQQEDPPSRRIRRDEPLMRRSVRRAVGRPMRALPPARVRSRTLECARSRARRRPRLGTSDGAQGSST